MGEPFDPETMQQLLEKIAEDRARYAAHWEGLTEEQMTRLPGPQEDWSIKDQIAHIVWWEGYMMDALVLLAAGQEVPKVKDFDAVNARVWAYHNNLPLGAVLAYFEANWPRMQALLSSLTKEDLYSDEGRMLAWIEGDTYGHYAEHTPDLSRYVDSLKS